ncbi:MAG: hypothetical protein ACRED1_10580 [Limisphaerales bacterium]
MLRIVKRLAAIVSCLLLLGPLFAARGLQTCAARPVHVCKCCAGMDGGNMACCAKKSDSPAPIPARVVSPDQLLIPAAALAWSWLPSQHAGQKFSRADSSPRPDKVPIFQRNRAILI